MVWYYKDHDQTIGPVSEAQIRDLVVNGIVTPDTHVWTKGMTDWVLAGETPLHRHFSKRDQAGCF